MLRNNVHKRNEVRQTARRANKASIREGVPAFNRVAPTCQSILDECDITYLSNRIAPHELSLVRRLGAREAKAGIPSCDANGVFTSPFTIAQYDVYLSDCHVNERNFLARQVVTQYGEARNANVVDGNPDAMVPEPNVSGTAAEGRARARQAAKAKAAADTKASSSRAELLMCNKAGEANVEVLSHSFDRVKRINLEYANAYIAGAIEADARTKALARWLPLPWLRARAERSRILDDGAPFAHVDWPDYQSSAVESS